MPKQRMHNLIPTGTKAKDQPSGSLQRERRRAQVRQS